MADIDPVRFGELIAAMRSLERQLEATQGELAAMEGRLISLEDRFRLGKGAIIGLVIGLGFALLGIKHTLDALIGASK